MPAMQKVRWTLKRLPDGNFQGEVMLPLMGRSNAALPVQAEARTKAGALHNAAGIASAIAANPILQAALPPGASNAIAAVKMLSKAAKYGKLPDVANKLVGKGATRLVKALKFW